jgi:hypothetical protein
LTGRRANRPAARGRNHAPANGYGDSDGSLAPQLAPEAEKRSSDPDLARVIDAWPVLPEAIRRAVLALVGSAG